jgi:hypothetical protein
VLTYISTERAEIRLTQETEPRGRCVVVSPIRALALGACPDCGRGHIPSPLQELLRLNGSLAIAAARLAMVRLVAYYRQGCALDAQLCLTLDMGNHERVSHAAHQAWMVYMAALALAPYLNTH